jgi:hypothetical protein
VLGNFVLGLLDLIKSSIYRFGFKFCFFHQQPKENTMTQLAFGPFGSFSATEVNNRVGVEPHSFYQIWRRYEQNRRLSHRWGQTLSLLGQLPVENLPLHGQKWDCSHLRKGILGLSVPEFADFLLLPPDTIIKYETKSRAHNPTMTQQFIFGCLSIDTLRPQALAILVDYLSTYGSEEERKKVPDYRIMLLGKST